MLFFGRYNRTYSRELVTHLSIDEIRKRNLTVLGKSKLLRLRVSKQWSGLGGALDEFNEKEASPLSFDHLNLHTVTASLLTPLH